MSTRISGITVYPVKSCRGISLTEATIDHRGIRYDRMFMVVDAKTNTFLSQRTHPKLALVKTDIVGGDLLINADGVRGGVIVPLGDTSFTKRREVSIHKDTCLGLDLGIHAAMWFSDYLGLDCALVRIDEDSHRPVPNSSAEVSFADAYPLLGISEASLVDLNARLDTPLPMDRFRPNLVLAGCVPYAEDAMRFVKVGNVRLEGKKPCGRCKITTVDQQTAETGKEPLKTLASYRRLGNEVIFGMNFVHLNTGEIRVGDVVEPY